MSTSTGASHLIGSRRRVGRKGVMGGMREVCLCLMLGVWIGGALGGVYYNPIFEDTFLSPDPYVYFHTDGFYYYSYSTGSNLIVFKSASLTNFRDAENATVYRCPEGFCGQVWAPEIHFVQNNFYIYFAMENGTSMSHRNYVIQALDNQNPLGQYSQEIRLVPSTEDFYGIDGTVLEHSDGKLYYLWSGSSTLTNNFPQKLFITTMESPTKLSGPRVLLRGPTQPWESVVNEGPQILRRNNRTFVIFSNYCAPEGRSPNYCLCSMFLDGARDPLDPNNWWHRTAGPVFWRNDEEEVYGPGHASFTTSPDLSETWIVYHAVNVPEDGSWSKRTARAERIGWSEDNFPIFPRPSGLSTPLETPSGAE